MDALGLQTAKSDRRWIYFDAFFVNHCFASEYQLSFHGISYGPLQSKITGTNMLAWRKQRARASALEIVVLLFTIDVRVPGPARAQKQLFL